LLFVLLSLIFVQTLEETESNVVQQTDSLSPNLPELASPCGGPCGDNNDCADARCKSCRLNKCVGAGNCSSYCDPTQDINVWCYNSYCTTCEKATNSCLSNCCGPCVNNLQCMQHCNVCSTANKCGPACGANCSTDGDCFWNALGCIKCQNHTCQKPSGCDAPCASNSDCMNNKDNCTKCVRNRCVMGGCGSKCYYTPDCIGQGNCTQCYGRYPPDGYGLCYASCNSPCSANDQCNGNLTNCGQCRNNVCGPSTQCGIQCQNSAGCDGPCHRCLTGICNANARCGENCSVNTDCETTCSRCTQNKCTVFPFNKL